VTSRNYFNGSADFLIPDGTPVLARCDAGFRQGRWTGTVSLLDTDRRLERGDVCQLTLGNENLRIIITDQVGSKRYAFIALIKPDPYETL
jgi:hypothetical protein